MRPTLYQATFNLDKVGDTFLDMEQWGKGIVFMASTLGRYWKVGPQQTLYLPGCFLKQGENKIVVFEQLNDAVRPTLSTSAPKLKYTERQSPGLSNNKHRQTCLSSAMRRKRRMKFYTN